jgi:hypothetical protein
MPRHGGSTIDNSPPGVPTVRIESGPLERARIAIEILAIIAAGLWAFYTFVYQEFIKPRLDEPALETSVQIERSGTNSRMAFATVTVTYRNTGKTDVDVIAEAIDIEGVRLNPTRHAARILAGRTSAIIDRRLPIASGKVLYAIALLRDGVVNGYRGNFAILNPGTSYESRYVVSFGRGQFDEVHVFQQCLYVRIPRDRRLPVSIVHGDAGYRRDELRLSYPQELNATNESDQVADFAL